MGQGDTVWENGWRVSGTGNGIGIEEVCAQNSPVSLLIAVSKLRTKPW